MPENFFGILNLSRQNSNEKKIQNQKKIEDERKICWKLKKTRKKITKFRKIGGIPEGNKRPGKNPRMSEIF